MRGAPPSSSTFTAQIVKISSLGQLPRLRVFSSSFGKLHFSLSCVLCSRTLVLCMNLGRSTSLVFTILLPPGFLRLGLRWLPQGWARSLLRCAVHRRNQEGALRAAPTRGGYFFSRVIFFFRNGKKKTTNRGSWPIDDIFTICAVNGDDLGGALPIGVVRILKADHRRGRDSSP